MSQPIYSYCKTHKNINTVFCDFFDTIVHRTVHPLYPQKLWAKFIIRELGIDIGTTDLLAVRRDSFAYQCEKQKLVISELDYDLVIREVFNRLLNTGTLSETFDFNRFLKCSKEIDFEAEKNVQFVNKTTVDQLTKLKAEGYRLYILSDIHLPKEILAQLLKAHKIDVGFDGIFSSCDSGKSKEKGTLFSEVLDELSLDPDQVLMIGDNQGSDFENPKRLGIHTVKINSEVQKFRNKLDLFGSEAKNLKAKVYQTEKKCKQSSSSFSEYSIFYYFFTERLYTESRKKGIKNLFFLAREGQFLKKIFDTYQELQGFSKNQKIKTHYLKMSRQSAILVALKPLDSEPFLSQRTHTKDLSLHMFLSSFLIEAEKIEIIAFEVGTDKDLVHKNFFDSVTFQSLVKNQLFRELYDQIRVVQRANFEAYLASFGVDYEQEGIHVIDVGWGGTMQESLHSFFDKKIPVTGYYYGLNAIYNITPMTKRYGLMFSIYPNISTFDAILKANMQINEQLLAADHGSTVGYNDTDTYTIERHKKEEKYVFENYICSIQEFMHERFVELCNDLKTVCYDKSMEDHVILRVALKSGLFMKRSRVKFITEISKGFYQNFGENQVGLKYDASQIKGRSKLSWLKEFIFFPEKLYRYLVKVKPVMYHSKFFLLTYFLDLTYYYYLLNFYLKRKFLKKISL